MNFRYDCNENYYMYIIMLMLQKHVICCGIGSLNLPYFFILVGYLYTT